MEIVVNEDIRLCEIISGSQKGWLVARTGLRSPCMIPIECKYPSPPAASASFRSISGFKDRGRNRDWAYKTKAVDLGVLRREVHDVSVDHPFSDYTQRERVL